MPENEEEQQDVQSIKSFEEIQAEVDALDQEHDDELGELSDEEKKEQFIKLLKDSRKVFRPIKNPVKTVSTTIIDKPHGRQVREKTRAVVTNETVNPYGSKYKQNRKKKNTQAKTSRKANR